MNDTKALEILRTLSEGVDPRTGEVLPADSLFQDPNMVRACFSAVIALEERVVRERKRKSLPPNAGRPWTPIEDTELAKRFDEGMTRLELSQLHERTIGSIESRLVRLGKITAEDVEFTTLRRAG